jgi:hypothetical protein
MYATIQISPYIMIQGLVCRELPSGKVVIRVSDRDYVGAPIAPQRRQPTSVAV